MKRNRYFVTSHRNGGLYLETYDINKLIFEVQEDISHCFLRIFDNLTQNLVDNHLESKIMNDMGEFTSGVFNCEMKKLKSKIKELEKLSEEKI